MSTPLSTPHPNPEMAQRMANARRGMEIDEGGVACGLGIAIGHADNDRFLKAQNIAEILGKIAKHRQFG